MYRIAEPFAQNETLLSTAFDPNFAFTSEAANLEYSILSAILGNPSPPESASSPPPQPPPAPQYSSWPSDTIDFATSPQLGASSNTFASTYGEPQMSTQQSDSLSTSPGNSAHYLTYPYPHASRPDDLTDISYGTESPYTSSGLHPLQPRYPLDMRPRSPPATVFLHNPSSKDATTRGLLSPPPSTCSPSSAASVPTGITDIAAPACSSKLQSIHDRVTMPYDYTEGYHFLMKHLPTRCACSRTGSRTHANSSVGSKRTIFCASFAH